ncbi:class A beta-lactamase [Erwinia sp. 9145]|uniref:class A beta-lactamase n=1 Tax=Erwinia sp. 9145 TaxID=1500895 RepID=UPI00054E74D8|nr:class A beta-lactamase [Erwinia sp. 9145]
MRRLTYALGTIVLSFVMTKNSFAVGDAIALKAQAIEKRLNARVGVAVIDTGSDRRWLYNAEQRFPLNSTFKAFACGALLYQADAGKNDLNKTTRVTREEMIPYAPVTETLIGQSVSLDRLCAATMRTSDNVAANKIVTSIGGPEGMTRFMREIGDSVTRLDRREPDLNEATPGDLRDTTTPAAAVASLRKLVLGNALSGASREKLTRWMIEDAVGGPLLRAGIPSTWRIADRTGAGGHGSRSVIAVMWPPSHAPVVVAVFITETTATLAARNAAIAELGAALAHELPPRAGGHVQNR